MHITRLSVRRSRPSTRCSDRTYAQPSTAVASKTEMASSESVKGRAPAIVEYGNGPERIKTRRAQGHCPPPDAHMRARTFNAPAAFPPNTLVTRCVIGNRHPSHRSFCSLPHQTTQNTSGRGKQGWNV